MGIPVAAGTDATRVASYNPWVCLHWLVTGQDRGRAVALPGGQPAGSRAGAAAVDPGRRVVLERGRTSRGTLKAGQLADLAVLTEDYFAVPEERIPAIESVLTLVGGKVVYAAGPLRPALAAAAADPARTGRRWASTAATTASQPLRRRPALRGRRLDPSGGRPPVTGSADARPTAGRHGARAADAGRSEDRCLELVGGRGHEDSVEGIVRGRARRDPLRPRSGRTTPQAVKETSLAGPGGMKLTVRMQGPYDADVPAPGRLLLQAQGGGRHDPRRGGRAGQEARRRHRLAPRTGASSPATSSRPCS